MVNEYEIVFKNNKGFIPSLIKVTSSSMKEKELYNEIDIGKHLDKDYNMSKSIKEKVLIISKFKEYVNGIFKVGIGSSQSCEIQIKDIITYLALIGATDFYMYHNHPSQKAFSSDDDKRIYFQLDVIGKIIGCNFLGSYIIADKQIIKV